MPIAKLGVFIAYVASCISAHGASCVVDWTQSGVEVNRGLLSVHGVMQAYIEPDPNAMRTFQLTNPTGTHSRLETWIARMEPGNDNGLPSVFNWGGTAHSAC